MHNTAAYDIFMLVSGGAVIGVLVWMLHDAVKRGKIAVRYGPWVKRDRNPIGFWAIFSFNMLMLGGVSWGYSFFVLDLFGRQRR
jgi:hypothetical protein